MLNCVLMFQGKQTNKQTHSILNDIKVSNVLSTFPSQHVKENRKGKK